MLQIRLDVLAAARQLATVSYKVSKAEFTISQDYKDNAIIVEVSAKTHLETSPIIYIRYDQYGTSITVRVPVAHNHITQNYANDYAFFIDWINRIFTEDEFVKANKEFWTAQGGIQTDQLF